MAPYSDSVSLRLPYLVKLATERKSLTHYTKGTPSPLARLRLFVCMRFQDLFHSPPGVLFAFPSQYLFTIGRLRVFSLEDGPPIFRQDYTCPALLVVRSVPPIRFRVRGYHPLWPAFPYHSTSQSTITHRLLRFRSPLLSESRLISFPVAT